MTDFYPPIPERSTEELVEIANTSAKSWQQEAIDQAKKELERRKVPEKKQLEILKTETSKYFKKLSKTAEEDKIDFELKKSESYNIWQMLIIFVLGPFIFIRPSLFNSKSLFDLWGEKYYLKFKQRIVIFGLSFICWFFVAKYYFQLEEEKRLQEIEKADISDWEEKHEYK